MKPRFDETLVLRAQSGDKPARNELWSKTEGLVRWAAFRVGGTVDRDDLVQLGALGWMRALQTWKPRSASFGTWLQWWVSALCRRARNVYNRRNDVELEMPRLGGGSVEGEFGDDGAAVEALEASFFMREARGVVERLPRRMQIVLRARAEGLTLEKVAARYKGQLDLKGGAATRESVRQLETRALAMASAIARRVA